MTNPYGGIGFGTGEGGSDVNRLHDFDDRDIGILSHHHTLGILSGQASPGDHIHDNKTSKKIPSTSITGLPAVPAASSTLPVDESIYGLARAIGVGTTYARADHTHGSVAKPQKAIATKNAPVTTITTITEIIRTASAIVIPASTASSVFVFGCWLALASTIANDRVEMRLQWSSNGGGAWTSFVGVDVAIPIASQSNWGGSICGIHILPAAGSYLYRLTCERLAGTGSITCSASATELNSIMALESI